MNKDTSNPRTRAARTVHDKLVTAIAEKHPDGMEVFESIDAANGLVTYEYNDERFVCLASVSPHNEEAASISLSASLGRVYSGYRHALRWLACNRGGNTVAMMVTPETLAVNDLWVNTSRITLKNDTRGIDQMLSDFSDELLRASTGLWAWFPHMLHGGQLRAFEKNAARIGDEQALAILTSPRGFCDWLDASPDFHEDAEVVQRAAKATGWVRRWDRQLCWLERLCELTPESEKTKEFNLDVLHQRFVALLGLNRFNEALAIAAKIDRHCTKEERRRAVSLHAVCLYNLGRYEELVEKLDSAVYDDNPRVWFWRSVALARLSRHEEAVEAYQRYESEIGLDVIGRKMLVDLLPADESPKPAPTETDYQVDEQESPDE